MKTLSSRSGIGLVGLIVILCVLFALSAVLVPQAFSEGARVEQVLELRDTLQQACAHYHRDTARYPIEYSGTSYHASPFHELHMAQSHTGWRGPYLQEPLRGEANPWGGAVHLYRDLLVNGMSGWDLDQDGIAELTAQENASVLYLTLISMEAAKEVDQFIDEEDLARGATWDRSGQVVYDATRQALWILILRGA